MARRGASGVADEIGEGEDERHRLCAVSRARLPLDRLIRFVAGPDGALVPDLRRRLPGRGVWVTAEHGRVAEAVRLKAFARSLKQPVTVAADLAEQVGRLLAARALEALSLANKAGAVVLGATRIEQAIGAGEVGRLVHAREASPDGCRKLDGRLKARLGDAAPAPVCLFGIEQLSLALGRPNVVHAALIPSGASGRFLEEVGRLARYQSNPADDHIRVAIDSTGSE